MLFRSVKDTIVYSVSSESFKPYSPKYQLLKIDSLTTKTGGCDSIVNRYAKYEYNPNVCTVTKSVSVTDTLIINLTIGGTSNLMTNVIKIYPNPVKDYIYVDFGDFTKMAGCHMIVRNELGSTAYLTSITQSNVSIDIKGWTKGVYVVQILDSSSVVIDTRKIIIQ